MLQKLSKELRHCYEQAEECVRAAERAVSEVIRADYRHLAESWLRLARSYEFAQRLSAYMNERKNEQDHAEPPTTHARSKHEKFGRGQNVDLIRHDSEEWSRIANAPFDRDLELAVIDGCGIHALVFPCRRILGGWLKATTKDRLDLHPTHWRDWKQP